MPAAEDERSTKLDRVHISKKHKLGVVSGVYIPVCLNIVSILMFLRFGRILGRIGLLGMLGVNRLIPSDMVRVVQANLPSRSDDGGLPY